MATIAQQLCTEFDGLNEDEQLVAMWVVRNVVARLKKGRSDYGPLDLATDRRNFDREAGEEGFDLLVYLGCKAIAPGRR